VSEYVHAQDGVERERLNGKGRRMGIIPGIRMLEERTQNSLTEHP